MVFLTVLKIIGFVIAGIVALVLLILALILFAPVKYSGSGRYDEKATFSFKASYIFHLVRVKASYDGELKKSIKILFFEVGNKKAKKPRKTKKKSKENKKTEKKEMQVSTVPLKKKPKERPKERKKEKPKEKKKNVFKRLKDRYNSLKSKKDDAFKIIGDPDNQKAIKQIAEIVGKTLKKIIPRKHEINLTYGFESPDTVGEVTGMIYTISAFTGLNINAYPDFENKILKADGWFKGHFMVFSVAKAAFVIYRNNRIKKLIKEIKHYGR